MFLYNSNAKLIKKQRKQMFSRFMETFIYYKNTSWEFFNNNYSFCVIDLQEMCPNQRGLSTI